MALEEVKSDSPIDTQPAIPARIPMGTILGEMAAAMDGSKKTLDRYKQVTVMQPLRDLRDNISRLTQDELDALEKVANAKENQNLWSYGHLISSAGYASLSIMFGAYLLATGEERGKNFVYGGSALLANTLMDHLGGWTALSKLASFGNEPLEQTLRATLPLAATMTTYCFAPHNLMDLPIEHKQLIQNIDKAMSWINMIVQVGNVYTSWVVGQSQRRLTVIEGELSANQLKIEPLNLRNETLTNAAKQINDAIRNGIKKIMKGTSAIPMEAV